MYLLVYFFALCFHPSVVGVVLLVTDLQSELFCLPLFLLFIQILTEDHYTPSDRLLFLLFLLFGQIGPVCYLG